MSGFLARWLSRVGFGRGSASFGLGVSGGTPSPPTPTVYIDVTMAPVSMDGDVSIGAAMDSDITMTTRSFTL